jgi:predicted RNA binding protein YcfA (HicA-like mRNA interferase family)
VPPRIPGISHRQAIRALKHAGYWVIREKKHTILTNGQRTLTVPRHNPIKANTMGAIVQDAGLTVEQFKALL